jgi:hypothetical protein
MPPIGGSIGRITATGSRPSSRGKEAVPTSHEAAACSKELLTT